MSIAQGTQSTYTAGERYTFALKSQVKFSGGYGTLISDDEDKMKDFATLFNTGYGSPAHRPIPVYAGMQVGKTLVEVVSLAVPATNQKDPVSISMTFCDSTKPNKRFRLRIPLGLDTVDTKELGEAIAGLGLGFRLREEESGVMKFNDYKLDTYVVPGMGKKRDLFEADVTAKELTDADGLVEAEEPPVGA